MNNEVKRELVTALRSSEYKQAVNFLRLKDKCFCVNGVLADLFIKKFPEEAWWTQRAFMYKEEINSSFLPAPVLEWAGIDRHKETIMMNWNDRDGLSFRDIADKLEQGSEV